MKRLRKDPPADLKRQIDWLADLNRKEFFIIPGGKA